MAGLVAGSACGPLAGLSAQSPSGLPQLNVAPPSLSYVPGADEPLPNVDAALMGVASVPATLPPDAHAVAPPKSPAQAAVARKSNRHAPRHIVHTLGLRTRGAASAPRATASAQLSLAAARPLAAMPQRSRPSDVRRVQFDSSSAAQQANQDEDAGVVTHAYLVEANSAGSSTARHGLLRPLSGAAVEGAKNPAAAGAPTGHTTGEANAHPVLSGPVKFDAAQAGAKTMPPQESESLLDLDLSALTASGPSGGSPTPSAHARKPARAPQAPAAVSIIEQTPAAPVPEDGSAKLIGTESAAPGDALPIARAPQLNLPDSALGLKLSSDDDTESAKTVKAHLAATIVKPTQVMIHETFTPREGGTTQSFHLTDENAADQRHADVAANRAEDRQLSMERRPAGVRPRAEARQAISKPFAVASHKLNRAPKTLHQPQPAEKPELASEPAPVKEQAAPALASAPALLPPAPTLAGVPEIPREASKLSLGGEPALPVPFVPGTDGPVQKANRPGLAQSNSPAMPAEPASSRTAELASSSSNRPISMRVSGATSSTQLASTQVSPQRSLPDDNPMALSGPVVRAVKQVVRLEPITMPAAPAKAVSPTGSLAPAGQPTETPASQLVQDLMKSLKAEFPGSRVELKTDEDGLVVEGLAASEREAKKILAMVRKTALCPVADRIITKR